MELGSYASTCQEIRYCPGDSWSKTSRAGVGFMQVAAVGVNLELHTIEKDDHKEMARELDEC